MHKNIIFACALIAVGISAVGVCTALADNKAAKDEAGETQALMSAKVTATQAAQAAEAKVGGRAASVSFEGENGNPFYHVEIVMADGTQQELAVDANTGEIMRMVQSREDEQSGQHGQDEGGENENGKEGESGQ
jgi:Peptidase propeptide and YPEB domain